MDNYANLAREKADQGKVRLSHHAQKERLEENLSTDDIIEALRSGQELEPYPDDPRGPSALIAGRDVQGHWIHVVCGNFGQEYLLIILFTTAAQMD